MVQIKEAEYIFEHSSFDNCNYALLKRIILREKGIILLRNGQQLDSAEREFTESIRISEKLMGEADALKVRIYRAEVLIRRGRLREAYEDCAFVFKIEEGKAGNYNRCFYHAAIIKYKQGDLEKSLEHFSGFFKDMKHFCKSFLYEKEYKGLEEKGVFVESVHNKDRLKDQITQCLQRSTIIFSTIYGPSHPFVRDYVLENCRDLK